MVDYSKDSGVSSDDEPDMTDEDVDVDQDPEKKEEKLPPYTPEQEDNLAQFFSNYREGLECLDEVSGTVTENFDAAQEGTSKELQQLAADVKLYLGQLPDKMPGFKGCANVHLPIMLKTITRLSARVCGELFGNWKDFVVVQPTSVGDDEKVADILSKHTNWQLSNDIPDFQRQAEIGVDYFFLYGDVVCHSTYDPIARRNRHEMLTPDEFFVPMVKHTTMPDFSDVPYLCRVMHFFPEDIEAHRGDWYDIDAVLDETPSPDDGPEEKLSDAANQETGIDAADVKDATPYKVIWYEGWLDLPQQETRRYCKVLLHYDTGHIFELKLHEQNNWKDSQRYDRQLQELMAFRQATAQHIAQQGQLQQQVEQLQTVAEQGPDKLRPPEEQAMVLQQLQGAAQQLQGMPPPPPPPDWADPQGVQDPAYAPERPRKEPIHLFSHGVCIEPPAGPRGVSFGRIEADFNRAGDTALSQYTDQATLNNMKSFLAKDDVDFVGEPSLAPGQLKKITGFNGTDIRDAIVPLDVGAGNPQLIDIVKLCLEQSEEAIQAPGVLVGEPGKSGETARGMGMRIEQATKQLTSSARRIARFFVQILKNNAALNAKFMADDELFLVQDPENQQWKEIHAGRRMYERSYMVEFKTDMAFSSKAQRISEADGVMAMISQIPQLQQNIAMIQYALYKSFEARGYKDYARYLGPLMPPPQTPLGLPPPAQPGQPGQPGAPPAQGQTPGAVPPGQSPAPKPPGQPSPPKQPAQPEPGQGQTPGMPAR